MGHCFEVDGGAAIEREKELTAGLHFETGHGLFGFGGEHGKSGAGWSS
jgi:hypothetical protein